MSVFILKLIAMCSMLIDHIAFALVNNNIALRNIGRFAFFIYAFTCPLCSIGAFV